MDTAGYDISSVTSMVAAGCMQLFLQQDAEHRPEMQSYRF